MGKISDVFSGHAKEYDFWYEKNKFVYISELEVLKRVVSKGGRGLEIGVGTGRFAGPLGISTGIDPSKDMLQIAKKRGIETVAGKGEELPFNEGEFDLVLMAITLSFVDNPDKVMAESRRVLKSNGKLIVGMIDRDSHLGKLYEEKKRQKHRFYKEANIYSASEVIRLIIKHGFIEIDTYQTIFNSLENTKEIEYPEKGFGKGGFVVISGKKT